MVFKIRDVYVPITSIVAIRRCDDGYCSLSFWDVSPKSGEVVLKTVTVDNGARREIESWLNGQITVEVEPREESNAGLSSQPAEAASSAQSAPSTPAARPTSVSGRYRAGTSRREARRNP